MRLTSIRSQVMDQALNQMWDKIYTQVNNTAWHGIWYVGLNSIRVEVRDRVLYKAVDQVWEDSIL